MMCEEGKAVISLEGGASSTIEGGGMAAWWKLPGIWILWNEPGGPRVKRLRRIIHTRLYHSRWPTG
jgi:hypothetical protein